MKNILTVLLLLCMVLCLCACGNNEAANNNDAATNPPASDPVDTKPVETDPVETEPSVPDGRAQYTAIVVDEGGNAIAGAMVQICKEDCFPGVTDAEGKAVFTRPETEGYKISFISLPAGYDYTTEETDFYYEGDSKEITIVLKAIG